MDKKGSLKPSEFKLRVGNNIVNPDEILETIEQCELPCKIVDYPDEEFWNNDFDTLVFFVPNKEEVNWFTVFAFAEMIKDLNIDEFDFMPIEHDALGSGHVVRMWWD